MTVPCCGHADQPVELHFLGVGGWLIRKGDAALLTAPLFTNPGLLQTGLQQIHADPDRIERHLPDVSDVSAVRVIEDEELADVEHAGAWIEVGPLVRIKPLRSDHVPHFAGIVLYSGERRSDLPSVPVSAEQWLEGETIAYLIDLLNDDGSVGLRVYYQDAVAAAPFGLVPSPAVLGDSVRVDVAIIVPATLAEVAWHPEALLESAHPRHVLLCHWEDFFQPPSLQAEAVLFTRLPEFVARLRRALPADAGWHLPMPGTRFVFH